MSDFEKLINASDLIEWIMETYPDWCVGAVRSIVDHIDALPSAEAVKVAYICDGRKCDSDCSECFRTLDVEHARDFKLMGDTYFQQEAEADDRHYIKMYADDEPSVKAEKLYQICGETQNKEVTEWLKEYFPSADAVQGWIPCIERLPNVGEDVLFCDAKWTEEGCLRADGDWRQFRWSSVMPKEKVIAWMPLPTPYKDEERSE